MNRATFVIFKGTYGSDSLTIRCSWTGSVSGIIDVGHQNSIAALPASQATTISGTALVNASEDTFATSTMIPDGAMGDVYQSSTTETASLSDKLVAVIPYVFIASNGAPVTNMTPQIFRAVMATGGSQLSMHTGNPADSSYFVIGVGRDMGSGARATAMAETGYGIFTAPSQYIITSSGSTWSASDAVGQTSTSGYGNGNWLAADLAKPSSDGNVGIGYVGIAEAYSNNVKLSYNGVAYSAAGVYNGMYTFWGYEHIYTPARVYTAVSGQNLFTKNYLNGLGSYLTSNPGSAGLMLSSMQVHRDGDGATVLWGVLP